MKNKKSIILGLILSFISIFILAELLQFIVYYLWTAGEFTINLSGFSIVNPENLTKIQSVIILTFPLFYIVSTVELAGNLLKHQGLGSPRFTLLIFIILNVGYLIVNVFIGAFNIVLDKAGDNRWTILCRNLEMNETGSLFFIFIVILLLMNYLRSFNKIVNEYIAYKK